MRIITTFNDRLYSETGVALIDSLKLFLAPEQILVYGENMKTRIEGVQMVDVESLPELSQVAEACSDIIPREAGGRAEGLQGYNQRWFNWFRKVIVQYDAIVRRPTPGYTIFLDSDVRMIRLPDEERIATEVPDAVGVLLGDRDSVESGVVIYRGMDPDGVEFVTSFLWLFLSGEFRSLPRWDDGYTMRICMERHPDLVWDMASGMKAVKHRNRNGHETTGQLLPLTFLGEYFEHDKGMHWRRGIAASVAPASDVSFLSCCYRIWRSLLGRSSAE
jgi:hypothetical protein